MSAKSWELERPRERAPMLTLLSMAWIPLLWIFCVNLNRQLLAADTVHSSNVLMCSPTSLHGAPETRRRFPPSWLLLPSWQRTWFIQGKVCGALGVDGIAELPIRIYLEFDLSTAGWLALWQGNAEGMAVLEAP